jgi:hypothetical protein
LVTRELIVQGEVSLCTEHHDKDYKQVWYIEGDGPTENRYAISLTEDELVRILQVHNVHYAGKAMHRGLIVLIDDPDEAVVGGTH